MDVFTRNLYKDILLDSLAYCQKNKGMEIYAWCIMTNHVHLAFRSMGDIPPEKILGDFKRYTSKAIVKAIREEKEKGFRTYYAFQWETGEFKEDMIYMWKVLNDLSGDAEEVNKKKFDSVVQGLRDKLQ